MELKEIRTKSSPDRTIQCSSSKEKDIFYNCNEENQFPVGTFGHLSCDKGNCKVLKMDYF